MSFPQLQRLLDILHVLRGPEGCPWDREQDLRSAARHLSDEVHEYADAAAEGDLEGVREELGDLLYMVAFNWLLLQEKSPLPFDALAEAGAEKLVRRHPHVFGGADARSTADSNRLWNEIKAGEKGEQARPPSVLKDLPASVSPLRQAALYGANAAETGFDWSGPAEVLRKLHEEIEELQEAARASDQEAVQEELGDLLFAAVQLGRKLDVDPDAALRATNRKFARRFRHIEAEHGHDPARLRAAGLEALWEAWQRVKREERG